MTECIFCKIVKGEIPCHKVYEDSETLAFLDVGPVSKGHTLVIPKDHASNYNELSEESVKSLALTVRKVSNAISNAFSCDFNILNNNGKKAGQAVFHVHIHIIPRRGDSNEFNFEWPAEKLDNGEEIMGEISKFL